MDLPYNCTCSDAIGALDRNNGSTSTFLFFQGIMGKSLPWKRDKEQFKAWREGKTGVPFVDANMRELLVGSSLFLEQFVRILCVDLNVGQGKC